ncbi:unnamed protein product [Acanthoscelides obtectus]|uniref:Carboxylic ester hydrolase n=1 Tax=Acanthoscelides obtectus TaxID=200917 RepID=A0A9P0Q9J8_ACAOB|nr:unnamed protein product [Acanthoscelides obtectus]CAK1657461.1 hypothetical protein AOBTE_LOCUS20353 [Acanthoscelides obtectus]
MSAMMFLLFVVLSISEYALAVPKASIPQGALEGSYKRSYFGRTFSAFEGIPYAKPPVEDLRFAPPEPADGWEGVLKADKMYMCEQYIPYPIVEGIQGQEDCLYLNVYVPREEIDGNENLDVVVHIHGGAFMIGAPVIMAGPEMVMDKDFIFVNFNYRLNIMGFLSTEDDVVSGNNGLKDQTMALQWIKDNIKYFGGNPASVTLTGLSAGGASVHLHYLSPLSKGLFHRGWAQSGTALSPWAITERPLDKAKRLARYLNCDISSSQIMVDCLRKVDAKTLLMSLKAMAVYLNTVPITPFGPSVETGSNNTFLPDLPYRLLKEGKINDVPLIVSNTKDEAVFPIGIMVALDLLDDLDKKWNILGAYMMDCHDTVYKKQWKEVTTKIKQHFLQGKPFTSDIPVTLKLFSERLWFLDTEKTLRLQSKVAKSPVYFYLYKYMMKLPSMFPGSKIGIPTLFFRFGLSKQAKEKLASIF